jgi:ATP-dependent DNA helicase RecG
MDEQALHRHLQTHYPQETEACEWKEFKRLRHAVTGDKSNDIASYVSAIANMRGGYLVLGVEDGVQRIVGLQDVGDVTPENLPPRLAGFCSNLSSEGLRVESHVADDSNKVVWVVHIPQHQPRLPVYAHGKAWQRI